MIHSILCLWKIHEFYKLYNVNEFSMSQTEILISRKKCYSPQEPRCHYTHADL